MPPDLGSILSRHGRRRLLLVLCVADIMGAGLWIRMTTTFILVTGSSRGIGRQAAEMLLRNPMSNADATDIIITGRDREGLQATASKLRATIVDTSRAAARVHELLLDVADEASREAALHTVRDLVGTGGALEVLINNAAVALDMPWNPPPPPMPYKDIVEKTINTNFLGPLAFSLALIGAGLLRRGSRLINVSAGAGHIALSKLKPTHQDLFLNEALSTDNVKALAEDFFASACRGGKRSLESSYGYSSAYGFSKLCVTMSTRTLAKEHPELHVHACNPGFILTDMTAGSAARALPVRGAEVVVHLAVSNSPEVVRSRGQFFQQNLDTIPVDAGGLR